MCIRDRWEPGASKRVEPTDENIAAMIGEKAEAVAMAGQLRDMIRSGNPDVSEPVRRYLEFLAEGFLAYIEGFQIELASTVYTLSLIHIYGSHRRSCSARTRTCLRPGTPCSPWCPR